MAVLKCKMCGGDIIAVEGQTYGTCDSCGSTVTLPNINNQRMENLFNRANHFRMVSEFDKAVATYEMILNEDNTNAEAHWGLLLSRCGIEYVEDPVSHERIPTCHRIQNDSVLSDGDYLAALEFAPDGYTRSLYEAEGKHLSELQRGLLQVSAQTEPFDIFICYKESTEGGSRTKDSALAQDIYYQLTNAGYKVFFSRITLEDKLGKQYEPYIFAALNSAKVMLAIGTKAEYFNAVWVKNEWSRFLALAKKDRSKTLIPCYRDMNVYDLPDELSMLQSQDMSKIGFMQDLLHGIEKVSGNQKTEDKPQPVQTAAAPGVESLYKRATLFLEDGDFKQADEYFDRILDIDPEYAPAYIGKLCAGRKVRAEADLEKYQQPLENDSNYQKAIRFADARQKAVYEGYNSAIHERIEMERLEAIYTLACEQMKTASLEQEFKSAAAGFEEAGSYRNSEALKVQCLQKAEEARIEREQKIAERQAYAEQRRIELEHQAKESRRKRYRILVILASVAVAAIAIALLVTKVIIPNVHYNEAMKLRNNGQWDKAVRTFAELGDYSDAAEQICATYYMEGETKREAGDWEDAVTAFTKAGDYSDAKTQINETYYQQACALLESGEYAQAYQLFLTIKGYKDVDSLLINDDNLAAAARDALFSVGNYVTFGTYPQTRSGSDETPIEWRVLDRDGDKALILSRYGLDAQPYNEEYTNITWENCTLRTWLNDDFINRAFTAEEQAAILMTNVDNSGSQGYSKWDTDGGNDTQDQIFLLSYTEANEYLGVTYDDDNNTRSRVAPTAYATAQGAWTSDSNKTADGEAAGWWLRSPDFGEEIFMEPTPTPEPLADGSTPAPERGYRVSSLVSSDGSLVSSYVSYDYSCVRPALWVNLESGIF